MIFYTHTRELVFNWMNDSFHKKITPDEFIGIKNIVEKSRLWLDGEIKEVIYK